MAEYDTVKVPSMVVVMMVVDQARGGGCLPVVKASVAACFPMFLGRS